MRQHTAELYRLFLAAGEAVVSDPALLARFAIPPAFHDPIHLRTGEAIAGAFVPIGPVTAVMPDQA
jgi:hypothetical protein